MLLKITTIEGITPDHNTPHTLQLKININETQAHDILLELWEQYGEKKLAEWFATEGYELNEKTEQTIKLTEEQTHTCMLALQTASVTFRDHGHTEQATKCTQTWGNLLQQHQQKTKANP
jgi:hypothetical protein